MRKIYLSFFVLFFILSLNAVGQSVSVLFEDKYPPYSWSEKGEPKGFVVDIVQEMVKKINRPTRFEFYPWSRVYRMGINNQNTLICTMSRTKSRENLFHWIGEVIHSPAIMVSLKGAPAITITSLDELKLYSIGTHSNSYREKYLLSKGLSLQKHIFPVTSNAQNYLKLKSGRIDLWCVTLHSAHEIIKNYGDNFADVVSVSYYLNELPHGQEMAFSLDTPHDVVMEFKDALRKIKTEGIYDSILKKYWK